MFTRLQAALNFFVISNQTKKKIVVAQLVERSLPTPEILGSNLVISKILSTKLSTNGIIEKTKTKKKRPGMAH